MKRKRTLPWVAAALVGSIVALTASTGSAGTASSRSLLTGNTLRAALTNDNFADATVIASFPFGDAVDMTSATTEAGEPTCGEVDRTIWYSFTAPRNGFATFDTAGSGFSSNITVGAWVDDGTGLGGLSSVKPCYATALTFDVQAGKTYAVRIGDFGSSGGVLQLNAQLTLAPPNDNFADATPVSGLPFTTDTVETSLATREDNEPLGDWPYADTTVWYVFQPSSAAVVTVDTSGSTTSYSRINVYQQTGSDFSGLSFVATDWFDANVTFKAAAGSTYYLQAGTVWGQSGSLRLNFGEISAPPNDPFGNAMEITSLPFSDPQQSIAATFEPDEPTPSCAPGTPGNSWWYSYTPTTTQHITAHAESGTWTTIAAFSGETLSSLEELKCRSQGGATFSTELSAGTTYYFQVSDVYSGTFGPITFSLSPGWEPQMYYGFWPQDPSVFDTVKFQDFSIDYGGEGIASIVFDFGDGTTAPAGEYSIAYHRYLKDGDYTVTDTVTTNDGRIGTTSQVAHVRTHDVSINYISTTSRGRVGKAAPVQVGIGDTRYPENVQVDFYKSTQDGYQLIGTVTKAVPVMSKNKTTLFSVNYTFTNDDLAVGKMTFQAVATILGARDAFPSDNTATSLVTQVTR